MKADLRTLLIIGLCACSAAYLLHSALRPPAVLVIELKPEHQCTGLSVGSKIDQIEGKIVREFADYEAALLTIRSGQSVSIVADGKPARCIAIADSELGIVVSSISPIKLSPELGGGSKIVYETARPEELIKVLEQRIAWLGLPAELKLVNGSICFEGVFHYLLEKRCELNARFVRELGVVKESAEFQLGDKKFELRVKELGIEFNHSLYPFGTSFELDGIEAVVLNATNQSITIALSAFKLQDVRRAALELTEVFEEAGMITIRVPITISQQAAQNFEAISKPIEAVFTGTDFVLKASLQYVLDDHALSTLTVPKEFAQTAPTQLYLVAFARSKIEAEHLKQALGVCLNSGVLPEVRKSSVESLPATQPPLLWILVILSVCLLPCLKRGFSYSVLLVMEALLLLALILVNQAAMKLYLSSLLLAGLLSFAFLGCLEFFWLGKFRLNYLKLYGTLCLASLCLLFSPFKQASIVWLMGGMLRLSLTSFKRGY